MSSSPAESRPKRAARSVSWRRFDSLFARALVMQTLVASGLLLVFGGLLYVERSVAVGRLVGEHWAPALRQAAGWTLGGEPELPAVLRSNARPPLALESLGFSPRIHALDAELRRRDLPILETVIARGDHGPALWLEVKTAQGGTTWLGVSGEALLPSLPGRVVPALLLALLLLVGSSWILMRRLTRPLERLRARMEAHEPGAVRSARRERVGPVPDASPEVAAIESAYDDLLARFESHQRERALLLAGVSHDLRSPLARIRLAADLLPDAVGVAARRDAIIRNAALLERLIESFLAHVRAGELALDQVVDVAEIARAAAARLERSPRELAVETPPSLPVGATHPLLIDRLLTNLLDNAFAHGLPPVRLRVAVDGGEAVIEVVDAGAGIPPELQPLVVQAFARGDASRGKPGTGLGLAIVARVVARMGGTLAFASWPDGHGVRVRLPGALVPSP
jgi:two-component system, OmpR family, osmolarity sensor histidine kinase EnvZ